MYRRVNNPRSRIRNRIRSRVVGTTKRPRLSVFRSNKHIFAQLIDDSLHQTLCFAHDLELSRPSKLTKTERAYQVGKVLAERALKLKMTKVVFDRGGYDYHGRVKAVAEGSRGGGLEF